MKEKDLQPHLALIAVQVMFGTWPIVGKIALRVLPSTGTRDVPCRRGGHCFHAPARRHEARSDHTQKAITRRFALYSLLGVVLNQFLFVKGLALSTAINATLLSTTIPAFTLLVSVILGYEKFSKRAALGTLVAAAGVIYLVDPIRADFSSGKALGNVLLVANTLAFGAYIAISKDLFKRYGALTAMSWVFTFGCVGAIPLGGYYLAQTPLQDLSWTIWLAVLYIILVPTVGAYYLNAWALGRVTPSTVAVYIYLQPLIAFALAPLVLGADEQWNSRTWIAAALIFAGVMLVTFRARARMTQAASEQPDTINP